MRSKEEEILQMQCFDIICQGFPKFKKFVRGSANGGMRPKKQYTKKSGKTGWYSPEGKKLEKMGVQKGDFDWDFRKKSNPYIGLAIEFKSKTGTFTPEQIEVKKILEDQGYKCVIIRSIDEFLRELTIYLNL